MNKLWTALTLVSTLNAHNLEAAPFPRAHTQSVKLSESKLLVAETIRKDPLTIHSQLFFLENGDRVPLKLPDELESREIVAVFRPNPTKVWVVSQWVIETGDHPLVSELNIKNLKWKELTRVDCIAHRSIVLHDRGLEFSCLEDEIIDGKYVEKLNTKTIPLR